MKFAAFLAAIFVLVPFSADAAGFAYGSIAVMPSSSQALLTYRALDVRQTELCNLSNFLCAPTGTSTPVSPAAIPGVFLASDGTHAVLKTSGAFALVDLKKNAVTSLVSRIPGDYFSFAQISPDGRFLAYYSPARQESPVRYFRLVDFLTKKTYSISEKISYWDLLSEENMLFEFSPDGKFLLYKDDRDGPPTLYRVDLVNLKGATFRGARLFTKTYSVADFLLTDAHTLLYTANRADPLRFDLFSYDLGQKKLKSVVENVAYYPSMKKAGDLVFINRLTSWGSQVMAYDPKTDTLRALPEPAGTFGTFQPGTALALPGGVRGALLLPDGFDAKVPHQLLIWLHGGPYRQTSLGYHPYPSYGVYDWMLEGLRASGVVVLKLDYHGSYGYGRPFAESLKDNVGVKDVRDVLAARDALKKKYNLSDTYLMGVSYGGYLALRTLVDRPAAFSGAISVNGVTDWLTLVNRDPDTIFGADFGGPLTEENKNEALYDRASVIARTPGLTTQKVILLHSTNDNEVSYSQSAELARILEAAGKNVEFTPLPNDDHVLNYRASAVAVCNAAFRALGFSAGERCAL